MRPITLSAEVVVFGVEGAVRNDPRGTQAVEDANTAFRPDNSLICLHVTQQQRLVDEMAKAPCRAATDDFTVHDDRLVAKAIGVDNLSVSLENTWSWVSSAWNFLLNFCFITTEWKCNPRSAFH